MAKAQISVEGMMEAGMHFGHQTFRRNPKMDPYIFDVKSGVHIIDLAKSEGLFKEALDFVGELTASGKQIVFVGTKRQAKPLIIKYADMCGMPYVADRWLGGLLTNYDTIKKRLKYLREIDEMHETGDYGGKTKKEKVLLEQEYGKLNTTLGGLRNLKGMPGAIFVVDLIKDQIAVKEAKKLGLPIIAIADTNVDPNQVDYPIPGNDDARRSIEYVVSAIATSCNMSEAPAAKPQPVVETNNDKIESEESNGN